MMEPPTPPRTGASSLDEAPSRKRRRIQDSSISGSELSIASSSSGGSYTAERYRVGIPALQLLPLKTLPSLSPLASAKVAEFLHRIHALLERRYVEFEEHDIDLCCRTIPGDTPSNDDLTLLIIARWNSDNDGQNWYLVADDIRELFVSTSITRSIKVELVSEKLTASRMLGVVESNHPMVTAWPTMRPLVHAIIAESPKLSAGWRSIDVVRIGFDSDDYYPMPITVSITVDWALDRRDWVHAERRIKETLESHNLSDIEVEFERGDVNPLAFQLKKPTRRAKGPHEYYVEHYPQRLALGADFGPEKYFTVGPIGPHMNGPHATIGGYIEIARNEGPFHKYAVTNYHCVREAIPGFHYKRGRDGLPEAGEVLPTSMLRECDQKGMGPGHPDRKAFTFESPSRRKHNSTLQYHDEEIQYNLSFPQQKAEQAKALDDIIAKHRESREAKIRFFDQDKHKLGSLWMCSGFKERTASNGRIDLAFIEVHPDRMGDNTIPSPSAWGIFTPPAAASFGGQLEGLASCARGADLKRVYKVGSRTAATTGCFNSIKSDVKVSWDKDVGMGSSTEYCFVAEAHTEPRPFQDHGDSGSFVFAELGEWIGVTWGGSLKANANGQILGYVTDAVDVISWIDSRGDGNTYRARLPTA